MSVKWYLGELTTYESDNVDMNLAFTLLKKHEPRFIAIHEHYRAVRYWMLLSQSSLYIGSNKNGVVHC